MRNTISFFGVEFHIYGLIIGLAIVTVWFLVRWWAKRLDRLKLGAKIRQQKSHDELKHSNVAIVDEATLFVLIFGLIGARLWHIFTEWNFYSQNLGAIPAVWNGGMSIIGAMVGGITGWTIYWKKHHSLKASWWLLPDLLVLTLPAGQVIGRVGNFVNQELFGLPTSLPWGIPIDQAYRPTELAAQSHFHPLFAYEMIAMTIFLLFSNLFALKKPHYIGLGALTLLYVCYYSIVRFFLDFLRIDSAMDPVTIVGVGIGINQCVMILAFIVSISIFLHLKKQGKFQIYDNERS